MDRGAGLTSQQIQSAPSGAVFIWCNGRLLYPRSLAKHLGRADLQVVGPDWTGFGRMQGCAFPIVVDHAANFSMEQRDEISIINAHVRWKAEAKHAAGGKACV